MPSRTGKLGCQSQCRRRSVPGRGTCSHSARASGSHQPQCESGLQVARPGGGRRGAVRAPLSSARAAGARLGGAGGRGRGPGPGPGVRVRVDSRGNHCVNLNPGLQWPGPGATGSAALHPSLSGTLGSVMSESYNTLAGADNRLPLPLFNTEWCYIIPAAACNKKKFQCEIIRWNWEKVKKPPNA